MFKRTKTSKVVALILATTITGALFIGCGGESSNNSASEKRPQTTADMISTQKPSDLPARIEGEKAEGGSITVLGGFNSAETINGNPYDSAGPNWDLVPFLYDYLADYNPFPEKSFKPSLLESYTFENKVLTMKLKPDLKWSDGTPLDADDILCNTYMRVGKSSIWKYIETVEKLSDKDIKITFNSTPELLLNLFFSSAIIAPDHIFGEFAKELKEISENERILDEKTGYYTFSEETLKKINDMNTRIIKNKPPISEGVYSGAYTVEKVTSDKAILKENKHYRIDSNIDEVIIQQPGSGEAGALARIDGTFDVDGGGLSPDQHKEILKRYEGKLRVFYSPGMEQLSIMINSSKKPLDKVEVRKAISYVIDRDILVSVGDPGFWPGDIKNSGVLENLQERFADKSFLDSLTKYDVNTEKADELLTSIGWTRNKEGKWVDENGELVVLEFAAEGISLLVEAASDMLTEYGITTEFKPMDSSTYWEYVNAGKHDLAYGFLGSCTTFSHPWESYNDLYNSYPHRLGIKKEDGQDLFLEVPSTGEKINVTQTIDKLFNSNDKETTEELTETMMQLTNESCFFIPVVEKSTAIKIYNDKLSLSDAEQGELLQKDFWYGSTPQILNKMLHQGKLWLVK